MKYFYVRTPFTLSPPAYDTFERATRGRESGDIFKGETYRDAVLVAFWSDRQKKFVEPKKAA